MPDDAVTLIYGINHQVFNPARHTLISAASCTTTGLAHMIKPLLENELTRRILTASMSTIHAVTNSQSVLDCVPKAGAKDLRKTRSVPQQHHPDIDQRAEALALAIPEVREIGFMADSIRVPTQTESLIILNITFQSRMTRPDHQPDRHGCHQRDLPRRRGEGSGAPPRLFRGAKRLVRCRRDQRVHRDRRPVQPHPNGVHRRRALPRPGPQPGLSGRVSLRESSDSGRSRQDLRLVRQRIRKLHEPDGGPGRLRPVEALRL